jgi:hypothetical protein
MTLRLDAEFRRTLTGSRRFHLCGSQENGKVINATSYAPDRFTREEDGYWKPLTVRGETRFTFIAQLIRFQDGPRVP